MRRINLVFILIVLISVFSVAYAINTCATGWQVNDNNEKSIDCQSICQVVHNGNGPGTGVFVPTKSVTEWSDFRVATRGGVGSVTLQNCAPDKLWFGLSNGNLYSLASAGSSLVYYGNKGNSVEALVYAKINGNERIWLVDGVAVPPNFYTDVYKCYLDTGNCYEKETVSGSGQITASSFSPLELPLSGGTWLGDVHGHLYECNAAETPLVECTLATTVDGSVGAIKMYNYKLWVGTSSGTLYSYDGSSWTNHGNKGSAINSMGVYSDRLWLGHGNGHLSCCNGIGTCTDHGAVMTNTINNIAGDLSGYLMITDMDHHLARCTAGGSCTTVHTFSAETARSNSVKIFDGYLWYPQSKYNTGGSWSGSTVDSALYYCDYLGNCYQKSTFPSSITEMLS